MINDKQLMNCPYCGKRIPKGEDFCRFCGKSLEGEITIETAPMIPSETSSIPAPPKEDTSSQNTETSLFQESPANKKANYSYTILGLIVIFIVGISVIVYLGLSEHPGKKRETTEHSQSFFPTPEPTKTPTLEDPLEQQINQGRKFIQEKNWEKAIEAIPETMGAHLYYIVDLAEGIKKTDAFHNQKIRQALHDKVKKCTDKAIRLLNWKNESTYEYVKKQYQIKTLIGRHHYNITNTKSINK